MFISDSYDLVIVGGGIAGASLGKCMAQAGARVLILEAAGHFKDRVRGEVVLPWGVAEVKALALDDAFQAAGALQLRWANQYLGSAQTEHRDLPATTLTKTPAISFYHPRMQDCLLRAAEDAGVEVSRGGEVTAIQRGSPTYVTCNRNGKSQEIHARLVVVADGRNSHLRRSLGFELQRESHTGCIAGMLFEGVPLPEDTLQWFINPALGEAVGWVPEGGARVRAYLCYWGERKPRLQGFSDVARLLHDQEWTGMATEYFSGAQPAGPLATFEGADAWVEEPYKDGIALLGDSAASSDPSWGQGLSLALRGARALRDSLLRNEDWHKAAYEYASEVRDFYWRVRTVTGWYREFFLETGAAADARRAHAFQHIAADASRFPDLLFSGPGIPLHSDTRQRFFAEDVKEHVPNSCTSA